MNDFKLNENNELQFFSGDLLVGESNTQDVKLILQYDKGHLKQYPKIGVGMNDMINGILTQKLKKKIIEQLKLDNIKPKEIYLNEDQEIIVKI